MEADRLIKDYEHEKHEERKRKGANLDAIFEQAVKKSTPDGNRNSNNDRTMNAENESMASRSSPEIALRSTAFENTGKSSATSRNSVGNAGNSLGDVVKTHGSTGNVIAIPRCSPGRNTFPSEDTVNILKSARNGNLMEQTRNLSGISSRPLEKANNSLENTHHVSYQNDHASSPTSREPERESAEKEIEGNEDNHYTGFKQIQESNLDPSSVKESKSAEFQTVKIKQEKSDEPPPVQIRPVQSQMEREKGSVEDNGEIGEDCLKFLLFSGKLYHCERISDLTHSFSRFIGDSVLGRKGKVVVLLLFHKTLREVLNYVVGVVDHYTLEEHNIIIKVIKHHNYPTTTIPTTEAEKRTSKLVVGSKKLLYNLQPLHGAVYEELVKILDGFGANSAVDHAKISEFNAMVNANADRLDGQITNVLARVGYSFRGSFTNKNFAPPTYNYMGSRYPQSNPRYSPLTHQLTTNTRFSPEKSHGGSSQDKSRSVDSAIEDGYHRRVNTSYYRDGHHVNTVSANQTVRITPRTANSSMDNIRTVSAVPIAPNARFRSALEDGSLVSQRRNVEDLQTVAELCKEKMKRDMAEQELKSIKAAFEEFKSQMQQHLSQVEERMVLLEAENRTLKGKLSNMHQNNGFAEKKYHELRSQLEDLLKSG